MTMLSGWASLFLVFVMTGVIVGLLWNAGR
jgi:hypothetical protein